MNQPQVGQLNKLRDFLQERFNREFSDGELQEIHRSLYYLGRALARYERKLHERNGN